MKFVTLPLAALAFASLAFAQEAVPLEKAQEGARKLAGVLGAPGDLPLITNVDNEKPQALKAGEIAMMVIPDQSLCVEALSHATTEIVPIGQLWTHRIILSTSTAAQQRTFTFRDQERDLQVNLYLLGATKGPSGVLELVIFGKDREPLAHIPFADSDGGSQSFPIEISGQKESEETGRLSLSVLGKHKADLLLKREE